MFASWHIYRAYTHTHTHIQPYQSSQTCTWWKKTKDVMSTNSSVLSSWRHRRQWKHHIASARLRKTPPHNLPHGPCLFCSRSVSKVKVRKTGKNCAREKATQLSSRKNIPCHHQEFGESGWCHSSTESTDRNWASASHWALHGLQT